MELDKKLIHHLYQQWTRTIPLDDYDNLDSYRLDASIIIAHTLYAQKTNLELLSEGEMTDSICEKLAELATKINLELILERLKKIGVVQENSSGELKLKT